MWETIQQLTYNGARSLDGFASAQAILVGFCVATAVLALVVCIRRTR